MVLRPIGRFHMFDPFTELQRVQAEMNRLFGELSEAAPAEYPPINIWTGSDGIVVMVQIPGIDSDDIELTVQEDTVTIKGERKPPKEEAGVTFHRRERAFGPFARTVVLPYRVDPDDTEAMFDDGVLAVRFRRPKEDRPKRIDISAR